LLKQVCTFHLPGPDIAWTGTVGVELTIAFADAVTGNVVLHIDASYQGAAPVFGCNFGWAVTGKP